MKRGRLKYIIWTFLFVVAFSTSCCISDNAVTGGIPVIYEISPATAVFGSYIYIYGNDFGGRSDSSFVVFDDSIAVSSKLCTKWNNTLISLKLPKGVRKGDVYVSVNQIKSNTKRIEVQRLPSLDLIRIEAGQFFMGSDAGMPNELPVHKVVITKPFLMGKYEVTQMLWELVMGNNPSEIKGESLPVGNVSWLEAIEFCNRLSEVDGLEPYYVIDSGKVGINLNSKGYRLPTEAEWEYACRAGTSDDLLGASSIFDICWFNNNSGFKPMPVGTKQANNWGLYDMLGNVWEWCWDYFDENYYSVSPENDPKGPQEGTRRVVRGGSWKHGREFARPSNRNYPDSTFQSCGVRIVKDIE